MQNQPFLFSDERYYRVMRHLAFWTFWWLFQGFLYAFTPTFTSAAVHTRLLVSMLESMIYLLLHIFFAYSLMYFVIPRFLLKQRYRLTIAWTSIAVLATAGMSVVLGLFIIDPLRAAIYGKEFVSSTNLSSKSVFLALLAGLRGGLTIGGLAAAIKLMKYWYVKEQLNLHLQKENLESQLQLLKAQVHPHFLFNTLNNLYSLTLTRSDKAPAVVTHLSDLLRYMTYECDEKEVPLEKEIEILKKYVELEKLRYGDRIDVSFSCSGSIVENGIAPLMLIPFVENSFKHGMSEQLDQCWVSLNLYAKGNQFTFTLSNSLVIDKTRSTAGGIGLQNIKKRLELIYPGRYELTIKEETDMYIVKLQMQLDPAPQNAGKDIRSIKYQTPAAV